MQQGVEMGRIGNSTNKVDSSDISSVVPNSLNQGHRGGRRMKSGMKGESLDRARNKNVAHKKAFRAGSQDARVGDMTGAQSRHVQTTRRRGQGATVQYPTALGGS